MGSMYAAVPFIGVQNASSVQPVVAIERTVFYRERAAGMYSAFPYTFAQVNNNICHMSHSLHHVLVLLICLVYSIALLFRIAKP